MTNETTAPVEQRHRDAAAEVHLHRGLPRREAASIKRGEKDDHWSVKAFVNFEASLTRAEQPRPTAPVDQRLFQIGDMVQRKEPRSYLFPGVVIAAGYKLDGVTWHCEVECIAPGVEGMTHVFPARSLETLASKEPTNG